MTTKKVFIVDDDPILRMLLSDYLSTHGYSVETLEHPHACLDRLKSGQPDVLILDFIMPEMTGLELLHTLRQQQNHIPVIMMSANAENESPVPQEEIQPNSYLQKPFDMKKIIQVIEDVCKAEADGQKVALFPIGE